MPTSFPDTDNSLSLTNLTSIQKPSFWDVMRALHVSKVAWMAAKIDVSRSSNHIQAITLRFLREIQHVKTLIEGELDAWGPSRLIREKLQRFLLKIHVCSFEADILRTSCVYNTENPGVREIHFDAMVINLRTVVKTFLKLRLLAPKAAASWNILHSSMSAALILAGLEKRLASTESFELLGTLRQSLNNTVEPKTDEASYTDTALSRNGLQALYHLQ